MSTIALRPPLPSPLSHDGVTFVLDDTTLSAAGLANHVLVAIASALQAVLPAGDLTVDVNGVIIQGSTLTPPPYQALSLWYQAGLLDGVARSSL